MAILSFNKKLTVSVCFGLIIAVLISVLSFARTSERISDKVLRLHVLANSDSSFDQSMKLKVRDAVLTAGSCIFDGSLDAENAAAKIMSEIGRLEAAADRVVKEYGSDYNVKITVGREYFTTRCYRSVTLPAGKYMSVKVSIGKGEGHNWWCVMFPPMCIPAAGAEDELRNVLNDSEIKLVKSKPKYEPRFKIVELYEKLRQSLEKVKK